MSTLTIDEIEIKIDDILSKELIVYNDDVNTFNHVINCLMRICNHTSEQAEQCTLIIHYKGKCCVKKGTLEVLKPMKDALCDKGLSAVIE